MGNFHVRPWCGPENLFDGNVLSFYDSHDVYGVWYGWELEQPENVARTYSCRVTMTTSSAKAKNTNCSIGTTGHGCH